MREFYLIDNTHNKAALFKIRSCELLAKIRLYKKYSLCERDIRSLWAYDTIYPSRDTIWRYKVPNTKWYINKNTNKLIEAIDPEWKSDFIIGMSRWGTIVRSKRNFPSLMWYSNYDLTQLLRLSPFAGSLNADSPLNPRLRYLWSVVPCLCFSYSEESIDYMAGVLSTGIIEEIGDDVLVRYNLRVGRILSSWGIPIERSNYRWVHISPLWPVLLQNHMPLVIKTKWSFVPHAYKASLYSAILWKTFTDKDPIVGGMPYLMSRRTAYNKYGSIKKLREMWIEEKLVELDSRFKNVVQEWHGKVV